jgi:hypothetical protein
MPRADKVDRRGTLDRAVSLTGTPKLADTFDLNHACKELMAEDEPAGMLFRTVYCLKPRIASKRKKPLTTSRGLSGPPPKAEA